MSFLDARWANGYTVASDELTASNGTHTISINREVRPGVQPCVIEDADGLTVMQFGLWPGDKETAGPIARVQTEFETPSWVTSKITTKWLRWQFKIPVDWQLDSGSGLTLAIISVHDDPVVPVGRVGTFTGFVENGVFFLRRGADAFGTAGQIISGWPLELGQWEDLVMQVKHATDATGFMKIWRNQRLTVDITGQPMTYSDDQGPYPKPCGLYYPNGYPAMVTNRQVSSIGMCLSDDAHTFNSFMSACGEPELLELPAVAGLHFGAT